MPHNFDELPVVSTVVLFLLTMFTVRILYKKPRHPKKQLP